MPKIVVISDTHLQDLNNITWPEGDILIHSGDGLNSGSYGEFLSFCDWFENLPYKAKIYVPGNHDWIFQKDEPFCREALEAKNMYILIDEEVNIDGLRIYGSPWTPEFCNWAFMKEDTEEGLGKKFEHIPENLDILVTHGPPFGFLDKAPSAPNVGSKELFMQISSKQPKYALHGHIHEGRTQGPNSDGIDQIGNTKVINCSLLDGYYRLKHKPRIIEL